MQNSMNQRKCSDMVNCKQQSVSNSNYYQSTEGVVLNHIYVANTTLIKLSKGELTINSSNNDMLKCTGESLILIEKNQTINIKCSDIDNHLEQTGIYVRRAQKHKLAHPLFTVTSRNE